MIVVLFKDRVLMISFPQTVQCCSWLCQSRRKVYLKKDHEVIAIQGQCFKGNELEVYSLKSKETCAFCVCVCVFKVQPSQLAQPTLGIQERLTGRKYRWLQFKSTLLISSKTVKYVSASTFISCLFPHRARLTGI